MFAFLEFLKNKDRKGRSMDYVNSQGTFLNISRQNCKIGIYPIICRSMPLYFSQGNLSSRHWWYIVLQSYHNRNWQDIEFIERGRNGS